MFIKWLQSITFTSRFTYSSNDCHPFDKSSDDDHGCQVDNRDYDTLELTVQ